MAELQPSAFEQKIEEMIAQLASKNAARRREAALFLGEAAAADAVPALVEVYQKDKNAQVRAAAAYSLGMYKAVENALKAGEETEVVLLLRQIEEEGKLGSRAPTGSRFRLLLALVVSLVALFVLYFAQDYVKGMLFGSTRPRSQVVAEVQQQFGLIRDDTRTLQTVLLDVISNHPISCIAYFNNPGAVNLDPVDASTFRDVATIVDQLNTARASLASAKARYDDACNNGATFGAAEAQQTFQLLLPALQSLDPIELELTQASADQASGSAASLPAETAPTSAPVQVVPTPIPPTPTNGVLQGNVELQPAPTDSDTAANAIVLRTDLRNLINLVDTVTDTRGASTLLVQYWTNIQNGAQTQVCSVSQPPEIPSLDDLHVSDASLQSSADMQTAVQLIRAGLDALHNGWTTVQFSCNDGTAASKATAELPKAVTTDNQFNAARIKLEAVLASL